jgi:hypothetical protein
VAYLSFSVTRVRWVGRGINANRAISGWLRGTSREDFDARTSNGSLTYDYSVELSVQIPDLKAVAGDKDCFIDTGYTLTASELANLLTLLNGWEKGNVQVPLFVGPKLIKLDRACLKERL